MKKLDIARLQKAQRMATEVAKKSRQARSSAKRKLEDQWEELEDPDNPSYAAGSVCSMRRHRTHSSANSLDTRPRKCRHLVEIIRTTCATTGCHRSISHALLRQKQYKAGT
ncbi:hypothetical protein J6590_073166 [Homalodisca vitripennis]|nr:hypothetical protein J6590_073166 [Homalodisca vitripennis]